MPNESQGRSNRSGLLIFTFGLIVALLVVFVGWRLQKTIDVSSDPYGYVKMGKSIANGEGLGAYGSVLNRRGPMYPFFIGIVYMILGERPLILQMLQALMQAAVVWFTFDIGRRMFNVRTGLIAGAVCALHPAFIRYVADFHVETFLTFLFTLTLWTTVRFVQKPSIAAGAAIGVSAGLCALTKAVALPYPILFAIVWWYLQRKKHTPDNIPAVNPLKAVGAIVAGLCIVVLPWTVRNYQSSGHIVIVTTGLGDAFLRGYVFSKPEYASLQRPPYTYAEQESNAYFRELCAKEGAVWEKNDIESERILTKESKRRLKEDFGGFIRKTFTGLFTFWYQMTSKANSAVVGGSALISWIFAIIGWRRAQREKRITWPLFLPILYLNIMLALLLALGRYSVPILPALTVLAAFGLDSFLPNRDEITPPIETAEPA